MIYIVKVPKDKRLIARACFNVEKINVEGEIPPEKNFYRFVCKSSILKFLRLNKKMPYAKTVWYR